jgi:hypothetical protein
LPNFDVNITSLLIFLQSKPSTSGILILIVPPCRNLFSFPFHSKRPAKNPLFEVISLHGPTGPLENKNFLASYMSFSFEPFQRTDISMHPLGPPFYLRPMHCSKLRAKSANYDALYFRGTHTHMVDTKIVGLLPAKSISSLLPRQLVILDSHNYGGSRESLLDYYPG